MRYGGGKKLQVFNKNTERIVKHSKYSASERFNIRIKIAHNMLEKTIAMNEQLCKSIIREVMRDMNGKDKK